MPSVVDAPILYIVWYEAGTVGVDDGCSSRVYHGWKIVRSQGFSSLCFESKRCLDLLAE